MFTFGKKTTASVLATFHQTLTDLQEVENEHTQEAERHRIAAEQATAAHRAATAEASNARTVAKRLSEFLGSDDVGGTFAMTDGVLVTNASIRSEGIGGA